MLKKNKNTVIEAFPVAVSAGLGLIHAKGF